MFFHKDGPGGLMALAAGKRSASELMLGSRSAMGYITFSANPSVGHTITVNGTSFAFVGSGATGNQINIAGSLTGTIDNMVSVLNASALANVALATYSNVGGTQLLATVDLAGDQGNSFTLASSNVNGVVTAVAGGVSPDTIDISKDSVIRLRTLAGGGFNYQLPNGENGQIVSLVFESKGGSANAVVYGAFAGGAYAIFDTANEFLVVQWLAGAWRVIANSGVTFGG